MAATMVNYSIALWNGLVALMTKSFPAIDYRLAIPIYKEPLSADSLAFMYRDDNPVLCDNIVLTADNAYLRKTFMRAEKNCLWSRNYEMASSETVRILLQLQAREEWALEIIDILNKQIERNRNAKKQL